MNIHRTVLAAAVCALLACSSGPVSPVDEETQPIALTLRTNASQADRYDLVITGPGMQQIGPSSHSPGETASLYVPPGENRRFVVYGYTGGTLTDSGVTVQTIGASAHNYVQVSVLPVDAQLQPPANVVMLWRIDELVDADGCCFRWNSAPNAAAYAVYASFGRSGPYVQIAQVTDTAFTFINEAVFISCPYRFFRVASVSGPNQSSLSVEAAYTCPITREDNYASLGVLDNSTAYEYDAQGNLVRSDDLDTSGSDVYYYTRSYDAGERLTSYGFYRNDTLSLAWNYSYNVDGRLSRMDFGHSGALTWEYDVNGRPARETSLDSGDVVEGYATFSYDSLGRAVRADYYDSTDAHQGYSLITYSADGTAASMSYHDAAGTLFESISFTWQGAQPTRWEMVEGSTVTWGAVFEYNAAGQLTRSSALPGQGSSYYDYVYSCTP